MGIAAVAFALLFFYSGFSGLIVEQISGVAADGLNGLTGRNPIPRETTLWVTWQGGLITHYGFFPVLLMIPGAIWLWARRHDNRRVAALQVLVWMTLAVSFSQAVLPLFTLSSITTRWLTFASWAVAVAGTVGVVQLWRRGRASRIASVAMAGYVGWLTLTLYIAAMALRVAPIEPF